jgi:hypothetical protein
VAGQRRYRSLTRAEVEALESGGTRAEDWQSVRVTGAFTPDRVARCTLSGEVLLGDLRGEVGVDGCMTPAGVYDCRLHNVAVGDGVLLSGAGLVANYDIADRAYVLGCDRLVVEGETTFGNGVEVAVLNEGGGRAVRIFERLSAQIAYLAACYRHRPALVEAIEDIAQRFADSRRSGRGRVGEAAAVTGCGSLVNVSIGDAAGLHGCADLSNGTVCSKPQAPATIGVGVNARDFIVCTDSVVDGHAVLDRCFVGQGCRMGRQCSAEGSAFFANCEFLHGEAVSVLAGPYSVSHHKSTLLIAGLFSFYNAGSGTNQSNHMYKLGPLHQGVLERGCKTGSSSYLLWPARVGPFSVVLGKHQANVDTRNLPFSYIDEQDRRSAVFPALNLLTVGTVRDGMKWTERDRRGDPDRLDLVRPNVFSPFTVGRLMAGAAELTAVYEATPRDRAHVKYGPAAIKRLLCRSAIKHYGIAALAYLGDVLADRLEREDGLSCADAPSAGSGEWVDMLGLLAPRGEVERLCDDLEAGVIDDLPSLEARLRLMHDSYRDYEWAWVCAAWRARAGTAPGDMSPDELAEAVAGWRDARLKLNNMVLSDAAKEFSEGSRTGYGIDGDETVRDLDFRAVRGALEESSFVRAVGEESERVRERADRLLDVLGRPSA